eukprot:UN2730
MRDTMVEVRLKGMYKGEDEERIGKVTQHIESQNGQDSYRFTMGYAMTAQKPKDKPMANEKGRQSQYEICRMLQEAVKYCEEGESNQLKIQAEDGQKTLNDAF